MYGRRLVTGSFWVSILLLFLAGSGCKERKAEPVTDFVPAPKTGTPAKPFETIKPH
jgi:hypothetical protein